MYINEEVLREINSMDEESQNHFNEFIESFPKVLINKLFGDIAVLKNYMDLIEFGQLDMLQEYDKNLVDAIIKSSKKTIEVLDDLAKKEGLNKIEELECCNEVETEIRHSILLLEEAERKLIKKIIDSRNSYNILRQNI